VHRKIIFADENGTIKYAEMVVIGMHRRKRRRWGMLVGTAMAVFVMALTVHAWQQEVAQTSPTDGTNSENSTGKVATQLSQKVSASSQNTKKIKIIKQNLQNYLDKVTADGTASVSFYSLDNTTASSQTSTTSTAVSGQGTLSVNSNAHTWVTAASTYKLYIAAYLLKQKQADNFSWSESNRAGFKRMIVESANDFPESILSNSNYGYDRINSFIKSAGWGGPVFTEGSAAVTTAYSLRLLLTTLANGNAAFSNSSDQKYLLQLMGEQEYRDGIPAGVASACSGATVQDKVGFLNDTNSDAGIVTLPSGQRYVLVILTHGRSQTTLDFSRIKAIAAKVQTIVYGQNAGESVRTYSAD
jgi:beta-lactamase class A